MDTTAREEREKEETKRRKIALDWRQKKFPICKPETHLNATLSYPIVFSFAWVLVGSARRPEVQGGWQFQA